MRQEGLSRANQPPPAAPASRRNRVSPATRSGVTRSALAPQVARRLQHRHQPTAQLRLRAESGCTRQQAGVRNLAVDNGEQLVPGRRQGERAGVAARQQPGAVGLGRRLAT